MILIDTHILLGVLKLNDFLVPPEMLEALEQTDQRFAGVSSIWEIAIKHRLGRLAIKATPDRLPLLLQAARFQILPITAEHALAGASQNVSTNDPFDRLMLGVCEVENMKLMTLDRALISHPLAWKPK